MSGEQYFGPEGSGGIGRSFAPEKECAAFSPYKRSSADARHLLKIRAGGRDAILSDRGPPATSGAYSRAAHLGNAELRNPRWPLLRRAPVTHLRFVSRGGYSAHSGGRLPTALPVNLGDPPGFVGNASGRGPAPMRVRSLAAGHPPTTPVSEGARMTGRREMYPAECPIYRESMRRTIRRAWEMYPA